MFAIGPSGIKGIVERQLSAAVPPGGERMVERLTSRERETLRHIVRGASNAEIARALGLREQTVKNLVSVLFEKLHVTNRVQLAVMTCRRWPELIDE